MSELTVEPVNKYLNQKYPELSRAYLKEILRFDYNTGELYWRKKIGSSCDLNKPAGSFNKVVGYKYITIRRKLHRMHRIIWLYHHGYLPKGDIDHIDQDKTNNRIDNLREATESINAINTGNRSNNTTGVRGVRLHRGSRWLAHIGINNKLLHIGCFSNFIDAVYARYDKEKELGWHKFNKNTPAAEYIKEYQREVANALS